VNVLTVTCAVCLVVVFAAAAIGKARSVAAFSAFSGSLRDTGLVPDDWVRLCALAVVVSEVSAALLLLVTPVMPWLGRVGFLLAAGLLTVLTASVLRIVASRRQVACRCFGTSASPLGTRHILRNAALVLVAITGVVVSPDAVRIQSAEEVLAACAGALAGVLAVASDDIVELFRPQVASR
jgi:hypothetical protein